MMLLDLAKSMFSTVDFGPEFLEEVIMFVMILELLQVLIDMLKGRSLT